MTKIANALDECLDATDPVAAAARYPDLEAELLPLLRTAQKIWKVPQAVPSPAAKAAGRRRSLAAVELKRQSRQAQRGLREEAA